MMMGGVADRVRAPLDGVRWRPELQTGGRRCRRFDRRYIQGDFSFLFAVDSGVVGRLLHFFVADGITEDMEVSRCSRSLAVYSLDGEDRGSKTRLRLQWKRVRKGVQMKWG